MKDTRERDRFGWSGTQQADMEKNAGDGPIVVERRQQTKRCPRCGQILFADMDVCYGCLYDFTRDHAVQLLPPAAFEEEVPNKDQVHKSIAPYSEIPAPKVSLEDDLDEPAVEEATTQLAPPPPSVRRATSGVTALLVRTGDVDVTVEVPATGLHIGRAPTNDVVLHSKAVSREHALLMPAAEGVLVRDLGSTNPPLFQGRPIDGSALIPFGQSFLLCGCWLEPCQR